MTALDVLRAGGNAVDAAVATAAVLCLTEPHMTGIGGDCFVLLGLPNGEVKGLNGSGRSSMAADAAWLKRSGLAAIEPGSPHAVTVPGAIDAWDVLLKAHGTMDLAEALKPAIRLAETGVSVTPRVAWDWAGDTELLTADEGARLHLLAHGRAPKAGEIMRYPALAQTLKRIAAEGRDAFYLGAIAEDIVQVLQAKGSLLAREDFARHRGEWVTPIATQFHGAEILEIPPNGQGLTALIGLNVLSRFDLERLQPGSAELLHLQAEALKLAWVYRNRHIADPDFADIPVEDLLSAKTADMLAQMIRPDRALELPQVPDPRSDTVYFTVVDGERMACSFINSLYHGFGSGIVTPRTGITLQNRGAGFVTTSGHPNCIGPGKRPLHTIIPAMAREQGKVTLSFGVKGGDYQPMGHMAVATARFAHGLTLQAAIDAPRVFPQNGGLTVERGVPPQVCAALQAMGHRLTPAVEPLGGGQAIAIDRSLGTLEGGSDPRKDGLALGYD